ncbi:30S ribosomal protein S9 [Lysinibacillus fusiformis]
MKSETPQTIDNSTFYYYIERSEIAGILERKKPGLRGARRAPQFSKR